MGINLLLKSSFDFLTGKNQNQNTRFDDSMAYIRPAGSSFGISFDGEQEPEGYGNIYVYDVDYYTMARRAYTLVVTNEFARTAVTRLTQFTIGTGLKLHPEPARNFLKQKLKIDIPENFSKEIQDLWNLFEDDNLVSQDGRSNIHTLAKTVFYNAYVAGDVLVIKRIVKGNLQYQIVNGLSVKTSRIVGKDSNNKVIDGVEVNEKGEHVRYYIQDEKGHETEIPARDSKGRLTAWLVYADERRLGAVRGYSPLGAIMQKLRQIGQYSNAEVIAANTNAKFAAIIEQDKDSSGVNPLKSTNGIVRSLQNQINNTPAPTSSNPAEIKNFADKVKRIASGIFFHLPKGQKMSSFDTKRPNVNYGQFVDSSMKYNYASLGIPLEVALLVFQNNFSASRASLKMFEMILKYLRKYVIVDGFYQIVYKQFFELECLKGNLNAPKYLALTNDNGYLDNAYTKAKFVGSQIPHIDETKEVNAVLSKLKGGLSTFEQALEDLGNQTDFDTMIERLKSEKEKIKAAGLEFETLLTPEFSINNQE